MPKKLRSSARRSRRNRKIGIIAGLILLAAVIGMGAFYIYGQPKPKYSLLVGSIGSGSTNVTGTQTYNSGDLVAVKATPGSGMILSGWFVNGTSVGAANPYIVPISENRNLTAVFASGKVLLQTSMGNITIQLRDDMPITSANFYHLVKDGTYDGTIFHRVIENFMIQGGDPTGTGTGDPSIPNIQDEFSANSTRTRVDRGTLAMANTGEPNSGSSQFFISVVNNNHLDNKHPVFGDVVNGMDVVDAISKVATSADRPLQDVTLIKAEILP